MKLLSITSILLLHKIHLNHAFLPSKPHNHNSKVFASNDDVTKSIESPVLKMLYPALLRHIEQYGNPNIPLGSVEGRACYTLRRLHVQGKLSQVDEDLLQSLNFRFAFDNIYDDMDFDDMVSRLLEYNRSQVSLPENAFQIPKKYAPDPELGAWVAAVRRIGRNSIDNRQREILDQIGFAWISNRKCGSTFMKGYRDLKTSFVKQLLLCCDNPSERIECLQQFRAHHDKLDITDKEVDKAMELLLQNHNSIDLQRLNCAWEKVLSDGPNHHEWLRAQAEVHAKGNLSDSRVKYMIQLEDLGLHWR